ncbi:amidohydrolase [Pseudorhodobacter sp.]|uniref:amidohydrolase n=1 Tax=Pseudorhodobacter sp. TaxID=1934400 RepID=UPI002648CD1B|nr:amidohydrolase [Pseudorhodobacter sp.]MDN5787987.1 amidohydrolase [Pseudorhodobacter sp.]
MVEPLRAARLTDQMTAWRHAFHADPELGFNEHRTAARVADLLRDFGLEVHEGIGGTGVVGILQRGNGSGSIGLRADMDALPILETSGRTYASQNQGVMHACGHDGHMAMLLGAASLLAQEGRFNGRAVFIFQPNEENGKGAQAMLADGLFERFTVDQVYGLHNIPGLGLGEFATRSGPITASESLFSITIAARGGHAALPHMGVDAITVGAEMVGALQTIVSRKLDPSVNGVVSVTEFVTDGRRNVLPGAAVLSGDARALTPALTEMIANRMRQIAKGIAMAHDVDATVAFDTIFPPSINAPEAVAQACAAATMTVGAAQVDGGCAPKLFSEDFAHLAAARDGCFILMGNGTTGQNARALHASDYDFADAALPIGASYWVNLVERCLP